MKEINLALEWDSFFKFSLLFLLLPVFGWADLLIKPNAALELRFGASASIEKKNIALSEKQLQQVRKKVQYPLDEKIFTLYKATDKDNKVLGYACLLSDVIRTHTQAVLYFFKENGNLSGAELIAYNEPPEYKVTTDKLNAMMKGKSAKNQMTPGKDLPVVTGSTLTMESLSRTSRLAIALWHLTFAQSQDSE